MSLHLPDGYQENAVNYFVDNHARTKGVVYQPDVYALAELLVDDAYYLTVIDVGCGEGDKLDRIHDRHPTWTIVGIDHGENLDQFRKLRPWARPVELNLEQPMSIATMRADLVICSDVIEHLADPRPLLSALVLSDALVVLSTPERARLYRENSALGDEFMDGPPWNACHVREWTSDELHELLDDVGFDILWHGLTRNDNTGWNELLMTTQVVVCRAR